MPFFIIFVLIPLIEISIFMAVGDHIGLLNTLILALLTAILGGVLVKYQGLQTFMEARGALGSGAMPVKSIFDGFCLIAAGALLITPGFLTDAIGFLLLVPPLRTSIYEAFKGRLDLRTDNRTYTGHSRKIHDADVIEADYERIDDEPK